VVLSISTTKGIFIFIPYNIFFKLTLLVDNFFQDRKDFPRFGNTVLGGGSSSSSGPRRKSSYNTRQFMG
jgi:hypothetical protein